MVPRLGPRGWTLPPRVCMSGGPAGAPIGGVTVGLAALGRACLVRGARTVSVMACVMVSVAVGSCGRELGGRSHFCHVGVSEPIDDLWQQQQSAIGLPVAPHSTDDDLFPTKRIRGSSPPSVLNVGR